MQPAPEVIGGLLGPRTDMVGRLPRSEKDLRFGGLSSLAPMRGGFADGHGVQSAIGVAYRLVEATSWTVSACSNETESYCRTMGFSGHCAAAT